VTALTTTEWKQLVTLCDEAEQEVQARADAAEDEQRWDECKHHFALLLDYRKIRGKIVRFLLTRGEFRSAHIH